MQHKEIVMLPLIDKDLEETIPPLYAQDGNPTKNHICKVLLTKLELVCYGVQ